ncbi:PAS domain S-box-containing protein [Saonia flava]|uniref:histidine kinase n=1 Tax=Saonia flava TaxID=523696 RepID=A0A846QTY8_9FLAO|nr:PAS domain-containing protein [Saonia flava]NJB70697.1 PAS domain S-box-containing protein [Saonia flava]
MLSEFQVNVNDYLIKQLPTSTAFLNRKLEVLYASDKWYKEFNLSPKNVIGENISILFKAKNPEWEQTLKQCLDGKSGKNGIVSFFDKSNKEKWFEYNNASWYDDQENVIGVIVQTKDITEKIHAEQKLKKLELLLKEKSEIAKIGSWELRIADNKVTWCDITKKIHEVPKNYMPDVDTSINFYKNGFSRNTISMAVFHAINNGTPWNEKLQMITAKGKELWVIAAGKPVYEGEKLVSIIGTFQDITAQVESEMKAKENEHLLTTLVDNLPINIYFKDLESRKVFVNKSECEYLGMPQNKLLGKNDFQLYNKEIAQISRNEDLEVMHNLEPILGMETTNIKKNGEKTTFITSKIPLKGEDGNAYGLVGFSMDITPMKQKEEELRNLINVTSLQNKKLINFAHIVSHNLRSHSANFSMLLDFFVNEENEKEKQNIIGMLVDASDNLLETLDNLNDVVAINTNINLDKKSVNLSKKIDSVQKNLIAFLQGNDAIIENKVPNDINIKVVPAYIESILMNFITNSVKYKDPNRKPIVSLKAKKLENYTLLSISDNGLGIDLNKYGDKLFGMYKTFHNHSDAKGIGLYITKNQIEAMNGYVTTQSEVGKGTTFNIYFNENN